MFSDLSELSGVEAASDPDTSLQVDTLIDLSNEDDFPEMTQAIDETDECKADETVKDYYNRIFGKYKEKVSYLLASIRKIEDEMEDDFNDTLLRKVWKHLAKGSQTPYSSKEDPLPRVVNDLKCIDVTEQWPGNQKRRRRESVEQKPEDEAWRTALEGVTEEDFKLLTVYARLKGKLITTKQ